MLSRPEHEYTIITPFGGQPFEEPHRSKYLILHDEHQRVCEFAGWDFINGTMGDDAARPFPWNNDDSEWLVEWLTETLVDFDEWWVPLGIHHPDHIMVRSACAGIGRPTAKYRLYEELPYRVLYPPPHDRVAGALGRGLQSGLHGYDPSNLQRKKELCRMYVSQVDDQLERCLFAPERLWSL